MSSGPSGLPSKFRFRQLSVFLFGWRLRFSMAHLSYLLLCYWCDLARLLLTVLFSLLFHSLVSVFFSLLLCCALYHNLLYCCWCGLACAMYSVVGAIDLRRFRCCSISFVVP